MRLFFSIIFVLGVVFSAHSQVDEDDWVVPSKLKSPLKIIKEENAKPYSPQTNPSLTNSDYRDPFSNLLNDADSYLKEKEKPLNLTTDNGLIHRTVKNFTPNFLKDNNKSEGKGRTGTQFLGKFTTDAKFVEIYYRDFQYVDGDKVRLYVNGVVVNTRLTLFGNYKPVLIVLDNGVNRIEFVALNMGVSPPNTAEFIVYDDEGNIITQNQWNLATGAKASFVVVKE